MGRLRAGLRDTGAYVAGEGLQPSATATTVARDGEERTVTDGPFAETKEQLGGFYLIDVRRPRRGARVGARRSRSPTAAVEVRPVMDYEPVRPSALPDEAAQAAS